MLHGLCSLVLRLSSQKWGRRKSGNEARGCEGGYSKTVSSVTFSLLQFYSSDGSSLPKNITLLNTLIPTLSEMVEEVVMVLAHRSHPLTPSLPPTLHPSFLTGPLHLSILTHHPSLLHSIIQQNEYWLHQTPPCTQLSTHPQWKYLSNKWYADACLIPRSP